MLLEKLVYLLIPDIEERLRDAADKVNEGGTMEDADRIVNAYFYLIKKVWHRRFRWKKPVSVCLTDSIFVVVVDGEKMDFGSEIHHSDCRGTESKMELEVLYRPDKMREIVQEKLMAKIQGEW